MSIYSPVRFKKTNGALVVNEIGLKFGSQQWVWRDVVKHQVSPIDYPKALLKIHISSSSSAEKKSLTFQMADRSQLEKIRKDITLRLQASDPSTNTNSIQSSSSRKRKLDDLSDPTTLAVTRSTLLAAHPTLRQQYSQMVPEILSEEDFWRTHQDQIEEEYSRIAGIRQAGTSSLLQSHFVTGKVQLGVEEMRQIFILYPAVHLAYQEKVPLELSDEQFWRKYLESEYFHRDRGRRGALQQHQSQASKMEEARAAAVGTDDLFSRYDQKLADTKKGSAPPAPVGRKLALGQFDLASTLETERSRVNQGVSDNHPQKLFDDDDKGAQVIYKYNRHWAAVLHPDHAVAGTNLREVARKSVAEDVMVDDGGGLDIEARRLVAFCDADPAEANHAAGLGPDDLDYEPLILANTDVYCQAGQTVAGSSTSTKEESLTRYKLLAQRVQQRTAKLVEDSKKNNGTLPLSCFPPPTLGRDLLRALTKKMVQDSQAGSASMQLLIKDLPSEFVEQLQSYATRSSELLRHFFGLRKLEKQQHSVKGKLKKIVEAMERLYRELEDLRKSLTETKQGETMRKMLFLTVMDQLNHAFQLHRDGSVGGGGFVAVDES